MKENLNLLLNDELFSIVTSFYNDIYEDSEFVKISITSQFIEHIKYAQNQFNTNPNLHELSFAFPTKVFILNNQWLQSMKENKEFKEKINKVKSYAFLYEEDLESYNCLWDPVSSNTNSKLYLAVSKTEEGSLFLKISHSERMNSGTVKRHALNPKEDLLKFILK